MKITFVTGSLEPGRTGVGDYTRLLAAECRRLGHEVQIIALNDLFTPTRWDGKLDDVAAIRLPGSLTWEDRWTRAARAIEQFDPEWISLQFVPYAFHPRGLFKEFLKGIPSLVKKRKVHIKFHEIWIGEYPRAPFKERVVGIIQKRMVRKLIQNLRPKIVHYTNAGAKVRLHNANLMARHLPIFGNIPVSQSKDEDWLFRQLTEADRPVSEHSMKGFLWFGFLAVSMSVGQHVRS